MTNVSSSIESDVQETNDESLGVPNETELGKFESCNTRDHDISRSLRLKRARLVA